MPQDNQLSPLFGHMQDTPGDATPAPQEVSDKTNTILEGLSTPVSDSLFGTIPLSTSIETSPSEIDTDTPSIPEISPPPVVEIPPVAESTSLEEESGYSAVGIVPTTPGAPSETVEEKSTHPGIEIEKKITEETKDDSKLAQYLLSDTVYQEMIREENTERIRLQLAIRYTLLMFAIFLVFAWIVSNRVIMFGFSEFVWLARIRDFLFAVMSGLFGLTLWFGSVAWTHNMTLISIIRSFAVVFFGAVIIALYIPL